MGIALVALTWGFVVAMLFIASLIGPFIMFFVPVIFAFGAAGVRTAHDIAFAPPHCEACGKVVPDEPPTVAPVRAVAPAVARMA